MDDQPREISTCAPHQAILFGNFSHPWPYWVQAGQLRKAFFLAPPFYLATLHIQSTTAAILLANLLGLQKGHLRRAKNTAITVIAGIRNASTQSNLI